MTQIAKTASRPRTATLRYERGVLLIIGLWLLLLPIGVYRIYATDEVQYYAYLRSLYFDGDLDFANEYQHFADIGLANDDPAVYNALLRPNAYDPPLNPTTGKYRNVAPVGSAILWSPFFVAADGLVRLGIFDAPADGYSAPYIVAVCVASAFYTLLGLLLSYRLARRWTSGWAATVATLTVWLASPLVWYTYVQMPWSHGAGFAMVALFLTLWIGRGDGLEARGYRSEIRRVKSEVRHQKGKGDSDTRFLNPLALSPITSRSTRRWLVLGVVGGLMVLVREQLGLFLLLPAIEGLLIYWRLMRERAWPAIRRLLARHILFVLAFSITLTPQLIAYTSLNGGPRPSGTVSGKLNLISYHFFDTLFDPQRGAFLWSPILLISLFGFAWLWRRNRLLTLLLLLGFVAQTYINGAFGTTWHLRGSFGFRRLLECTPIFVIGLALVIERLHWPRSIVAALALMFVLWNGGLIVQASINNDLRNIGLNWHTMLSDQLAAPQRLWHKGYDLLFDRCKVVKNC